MVFHLPSLTEYMLLGTSAILSILITGVMKAAKDKLLFHFKESIFSNEKRFKRLWWDPSISHINKWKHGKKEDGERFPFSSTIFVWYTDAWHFFQMLQNVFSKLAVFFMFSMYIPYSYSLGVVLLWYCAETGIFELFFKKLLVRR